MGRVYSRGEVRCLWVWGGTAKAVKNPGVGWDDYRRILHQRRNPVSKRMKVAYSSQAGFELFCFYSIAGHTIRSLL